MLQIQLLMRHLFYCGVKQLHPDKIQLKCGQIPIVVLGEHKLWRFGILDKYGMSHVFFTNSVVADVHCRLEISCCASQFH